MMNEHSHASQMLENSRMQQQPPKFGLTDFEAMIEKAMQEAGEQPVAVPQTSAADNPTGSTSKKHPAKAAKEDGKGESANNPVKKKKNEEAAALLEKRKRYDPRQALKKGKKTKTGKKPTAASKTKNENDNDNENENGEQEERQVK